MIDDDLTRKLGDAGIDLGAARDGRRCRRWGASAADRLDALRKRGGLMARDIAAMLDASVQTISRWQTGKGEPHRKLSGRLLVLEQLVDKLAAFYPPHRIHDWLFPPHRLLGGESPAGRIAAGRGDEVLKLVARLRDGAVRLSRDDHGPAPPRPPR